LTKYQDYHRETMPGGESLALENECRFPGSQTEKRFAAAAGLVGVPGHRSVGGMRVSLYSAVTPEVFESLTLKGSLVRECAGNRA
jgi:hypothetical protein